MVKLSRAEVERAVLKHFKKEGHAPIAYFIGRGSLHFLVWDGVDFRVGGEVHGVTTEDCEGGFNEENLFLIERPQVIQVKTYAPSIQMMPDDELADVMKHLQLLRKGNPTFVPYDAEWELCNSERDRRFEVRKSISQRRKLIKP